MFLSTPSALAIVKTRAEMRLGELTAAMPKSVGGRPEKTCTPKKQVLETKAEALAKTNHKIKKLENDSGVDFLNSKASTIKEAGFTPKQAERFQQLASHPEIVEQAKAEARENDDIVSRSLVLKKIKEKKRN